MLPLQSTVFYRYILSSLQNIDNPWLVQIIPESRRGECASQLILSCLVQSFAKEWQSSEKKYIRTLSASKRNNDPARHNWWVWMVSEHLKYLLLKYRMFQFALLLVSVLYQRLLYYTSKSYNAYLLCELGFSGTTTDIICSLPKGEKAFLFSRWK